MKPGELINDVDRANFLRRLMASPLMLDDWEQRFTAGFRSGRQTIWFTEARRVATDRMWLKYGGARDLGLPFPQSKPAVTTLPKAEADGCEYLVREDGRQRRCNEPAVLMRENGFRYCQAHADAAVADLKRMGKQMSLVTFRP